MIHEYNRLTHTNDTTTCNVKIERFTSIHIYTVDRW